MPGPHTRSCTQSQTPRASNHLNRMFVFFFFTCVMKPMNTWKKWRLQTRWAGAGLKPISLPHLNQTSHPSSLHVFWKKVIIPDCGLMQAVNVKQQILWISLKWGKKSCESQTDPQIYHGSWMDVPTYCVTKQWTVNTLLRVHLHVRGYARSTLSDSVRISQHLPHVCYSTFWLKPLSPWGCNSCWGWEQPALSGNAFGGGSPVYELNDLAIVAQSLLGWGS